MIGHVAIIVALGGLIAAGRYLGWYSPGLLGNEAAVTFGFILLVSYLCGLLSRRAKMPKITGYLLAGIVFGPYVMGRLWPDGPGLTRGALDQLAVFNQLALGLIALSAGGEMRLRALRERVKSILSVTAGQTVAAYLLVVPLILLIGRRFEFLQPIRFSALVGVAFIVAVLCVAKSPSSTIALIIEFRSKGPLTTTTLGVTVLKDVVVIVLFSVTMAFTRTLLDNSAFDAGFVTRILWEVFGSVGLGLVLGYLLGLYTRHVGRGLPLILLALSFVGLELAREIHLSGLLLCMTAGFYVENFTEQGDALIQSLDRYSLPVFVLFFTITGANLDLSTLVPMWIFVVVIAGIRLVSIWLGTTGGAWIAGDPPAVRNNLWMGFITQAGVTLGLATIIGEALPQVGYQLKNAVIAVVAINQIVGPVLFRAGLLRSGEATVKG